VQTTSHSSCAALDAGREQAFQAAETERRRLYMERARCEAAAERACAMQRHRGRIQCCYVVIVHRYMELGHFPARTRKVAPIFERQLTIIATGAHGYV
jgi:hypothetical protein